MILEISKETLDNIISALEGHHRIKQKVVEVLTIFPCRGGFHVFDGQWRDVTWGLSLDELDTFDTFLSGTWNVNDVPVITKLIAASSAQRNDLKRQMNRLGYR